jgi:hypothetical protein
MLSESQESFKLNENWQSQAPFINDCHLIFSHLEIGAGTQGSSSEFDCPSTVQDWNGISLKNLHLWLLITIGFFSI